MIVFALRDLVALGSCSKRSRAAVSVFTRFCCRLPRSVAALVSARSARRRQSIEAKVAPTGQAPESVVVVVVTGARVVVVLVLELVLELVFVVLLLVVLVVVLLVVLVVVGVAVVVVVEVDVLLVVDDVVVVGGMHAMPTASGHVAENRKFRLSA